MGSLFAFLLQYGYCVLFGAVLAEQIGLPIPATPVLLAMGALAGLGKFSLTGAMALAVAACLLGDLCWYGLGRIQGQAILSLLCKLSFEPDYCIRRTKGIFGRYGDKGLLLAKFIPGLSTAAPPMAGLTRMPLLRFGMLDAGGSLLWAGVFLGAGFVFRLQLERLSAWLEETGRLAGGVIAGALGLYFLWQIYTRRRFLRSLRAARVTPEEVRDWLDKDVPAVIVDLRHDSDVETYPQRLPGALRISPEELEHHHETIPRDREVVLYCS